MRFLFAYLFHSALQKLANAPWKGLLVSVPGFSLSLIESLTAGFRLTAAILSCVVAGLTIYSWIEVRIKKRKEP